jgi:hypothetical protein
MKNTKTIWIENLQLWLDCCILPQDATQPSVNIMNPYRDGDGDWMVIVSTNHDFQTLCYERSRKQK